MATDKRIRTDEAIIRCRIVDPLGDKDNRNLFLPGCRENVFQSSFCHRLDHQASNAVSEQRFDLALLPGNILLSIKYDQLHTQLTGSGTSRRSQRVGKMVGQVTHAKRIPRRVICRAAGRYQRRQKDQQD